MAAKKRAPMTDTKRLLLMLEALRLAMLVNTESYGTSDRLAFRVGSDALSARALKGLGR